MLHLDLDFVLRNEDLLLVLQLLISRLCPSLRLLPVLPSEVEVQQHEINQTNTPTTDDRDFRGDVARCIAGTEGLWA